jgi:hypothetical protein
MFLDGLEDKDFEWNGSKHSLNLSAINFFMNVIFICYCHFHISELLSHFQRIYSLSLPYNFLLSSNFLPINTKIKIHKTIFQLRFCMGVKFKPLTKVHHKLY